MLLLYYWATFKKRGRHRIRLDTRVYLQPGDSAGRGGVCVGCIIGKNPGSAVPEIQRRGPVAVVLEGDRFLPNVRAIVTKSYRLAAVRIPENAYVQVLNLFYLCDRDLSSALRTLRTLRTPRTTASLPRCPTEQHQFRWAWYAWGGDDQRLNAMKRRFDCLRADHSFYYDGARKAVIPGAPGACDMARHTQGLAHEPLVRHLATLIARG